MRRDGTEDRLKRCETAEQVVDEMGEGGVKNDWGNGLGHLGGWQGFLQDRESRERSRQRTILPALLWRRNHGKQSVEVMVADSAT